MNLYFRNALATALLATMSLLTACGGGDAAPTTAVPETGTNSPAVTPTTPAAPSTPASPVTPVTPVIPVTPVVPTVPTTPAGTQSLTISMVGSGTVADGTGAVSCAANCSAALATGTALTLTAQPSSGQVFDGWQGACTGTGSCTVTLQTATALTARFSAASAPQPNGQSLFVATSASGTVTVTLHPGSQVTLGQPVAVAFGVPLPRGLVSSVSALRIVNGSGAEVPSSVRELTRWRSIPAGAESVRAALFFVDVTFAQRAPQTLTVQFGQTRSAERAGSPPTIASLWTSIANGPNPAEYPSGDDIREPSVYATLPPEWLSNALLVTRTTPTGQNPAFAWWDSALVNFSRTAVNDVAVTVPLSAQINLIAEEPWLYDRALTLFSVYIRTGDVNWLRRAHRAAQFYSKRVGSNGIFALSSNSADLKYSYGLSPLIDYLFTGDEALKTTISRVAQAGMSGWQTTYSAGMSFWTERHQTYALLAALSAFEATGDLTQATRATALVNLTLQMSQNAASCPLHTVDQHEGVSGDVRLMCSPWMGALLAEAMLRYYIVSEDVRVLQWLASMGDYLRQYGSYDGGLRDSAFNGRSVPWYLAGTSSQFENGAVSDDIEHSCDAAGLAAKAVWAKRRLGLAHAATETTADALLASCQYVLNSWHRSAPALAEYRLTPPRKVSWWFGSSTDVQWMLGR
jgi:hypothetical protein